MSALSTLWWGRGGVLVGSCLHSEIEDSVSGTTTRNKHTERLCQLSPSAEDEIND